MFKILRNVVDFHHVIDRLHKHGPLAYKVLGHVRQSLMSSAGDEIVVDDWPNFKVVLARPTPKSQPYTSNCYSIFTTDTNRATKFLTRDGVLPWKQDFVFAGINTKLGDVLHEAASEMGCKLDDECLGPTSYILEMKNGGQSSELMDLPSGYSIGNLDVSDAKRISDVWAYDSEGCEEYVRYLIEHQQTACVRFSGSSTEPTGSEATQKPNQNDITAAHMSIPEHDSIHEFPNSVTETQGDLVAWYLQQSYGVMGMLRVMEPHRRKGLATALKFHVAAQVRAQGHPVFTYIEMDNEISLQLQKKCGFELIPGTNSQWMRCSPARAESSKILIWN